MTLKYIVRLRLTTWISPRDGYILIAPKLARITQAVNQISGTMRSSLPRLQLRDSTHGGLWEAIRDTVKATGRTR